MSDAAASALMALFLGGSALGGLVGGWLGDKAARVTSFIHFSIWMHGIYSAVPAPSIPHAAGSQGHALLLTVCSRCRPNMAASSCARSVCLQACHSQYCSSRSAFPLDYLHLYHWCMFCCNLYCYASQSRCVWAANDVTSSSPSLLCSSARGLGKAG
jgi:hypothetical protein